MRESGGAAMGVAKILVWGTLQGRGRWGSWGRSTPDAGEFSKIFKKFLKEIAKKHYFSIFFKILIKLCVDFSRGWTKNTNFWEILINFQKIS